MSRLERSPSRRSWWLFYAEYDRYSRQMLISDIAFRSMRSGYHDDHALRQETCTTSHSSSLIIR